MLKDQDIKELIKLIDQSSISEFTYENNGTTVSIKKPNHENVEKVVQPITSPVVQQPAVEQADPVMVETNEKMSKQPDEKPTIETDDSLEEIVSPMVGTFYRKPTPDSDPYVEVGTKINEDSIVCIVEAMKLFNEIEAELSGEIVEILVGDGELVEYGQPLFKVKSK